MRGTGPEGTAQELSQSEHRGQEQRAPECSWASGAWKDTERKRRWACEAARTKMQSSPWYRTASKTKLGAWPQLLLPEPELQAAPRELKEVCKQTGPGDAQEGDGGPAQERRKMV